MTPKQLAKRAKKGERFRVMTRDDIVERIPDLSRCPWCRSTAGEPYPTGFKRAGKWYWYVQCGSRPCEASGPLRESRVEAMHAWNNTRASVYGEEVGDGD